MHHAGTCSQCPYPLHFTPGNSQGMFEMGFGLVFYFLHKLNTCAFPTGPDSSMAPAVAIAVGVLVPLTSILLLTFLLYPCLRHLRDPERNPTRPCWVGLPFVRVLQGSPPQVMGLSTVTWLCPATPGLPAHCPSQAEPGLETDTGISPQPDSWEGET